MRLAVAVLLFNRACGPMQPVETDPVDPDTEDPDSDVDPGSDSDPDTDPDTLPPGDVQTLSGELTWTLDFDAAAEAAGFTDCTYARRYSAEQDESRPWLCPTCDLILRADVAFTAGEAACYRQLTGSRAPPNELLGRTAGRWWRARDWNVALMEMGPATLSGTTWTVSAQGSAPHTTGTVSYGISGAFALSARDGDPMHGLEPPATYACGWTPSGRPAYAGDHVLAVGRALPDAVFTDRCGDPVRLYDLFDGYLILYTATTDCAQCRQMAQAQVAFEEEVAGLGWDVTVVTLLSPTLADAAGDVSIAALTTWMGSVGLSTRPVLADRGYGFAVLGEAFPASVVVAPDGRVIDIAEGYAGSWDYWGLQIDQHLHGE